MVCEEIGGASPKRIINPAIAILAGFEHPPSFGRPDAPVDHEIERGRIATGRGVSNKRLFLWGDGSVRV